METHHLLVPVATWNAMALHRWSGSHQPALVTEDGTVTGETLLGQAAGAARMLDELGFRAGDAVPAILDENRNSVALAVGAALTRRALAPLGTKLPVEDLVAMVRGIGASHLIGEPGRADLAREVAQRAGVSLRVVADAFDPAPVPEGSCRPDDPVVVVHTSGTTGPAKPVVMRQAAMAARVTRYRGAIGLEADDRYCSASPFHHTASVAMTFTALGVGAAVIPQDWFSIDGRRRAGRLGVTVALLVPTMIDILLAEGALGDAAPRVLQYGAAPIHPGTLTEALAALPATRFVQIFGQTEISPITALGHDDHRRALAGRPGLLATVGRAVDGCELRVEHPDDEQIGEIAVRADHAFQVDADGWRRTGDLGRVDDDGYLTLHGRVGDRIVRGGENIFPSEIERVLQDHDAVREAAVVGMPDRRWGEIVRAVVVPTDADAPPSAAELRTHAAERLAVFKIPAEILFTTELPRNAAGKIQRSRLR